MKYLIIVFYILLSGCKHGIPDFPVEYVYYAEQGSVDCVRYKIISQNPIKLGDGEQLTTFACPHGILGIPAEDIAKTRDWIIDMQKSLETCK